MIPKNSPQQTPYKVTENAGEALKHFAVAYVFLIIGLIGLFFNSKLLATGGARSLRAVSGLHFFTLGWLSLSIFGAIQVFSGVALGGVRLNGSLAIWGRRIWSTGLVFFVTGLLIENKAIMATGFFLLGLALIFYTIQIIPALLGAERGLITRTFISIAFFSLWCAWILGVIGGLARSGWMPAVEHLPPGYLQAHILLAIFAWVGSMVIGVGSHLVPMFALSRNTPQIPLKITLGCWIGLPLAAILSAFYPTPWVEISWRIAAVGSVFWAIQFFLYLHYRIRREKDHGLFIAGFATTFLIFAWIVAGLSKDSTLFIALFLVGWLCFFTLGIYHRVIPFLVWFMRYSQPVKGLRPPKVKDLLDSGISLVVVFIVTTGILAWATGLGLHNVEATYLGSGLMLVGALFCSGHLRTLKGGTGISQIIILNLKSKLSLVTKEVEADHGANKRNDPGMS